MGREFVCELDSLTKSNLQIFFLRNVKNVEEIRTNVISGAWKCAIIKASVILDPFQIAVAANRAVVSEKHNTLVTRTVFAEIIFNLSLSKNIRQSLNTFGIEDNNDLLICFLRTPFTDCAEEILSKINGDICPMSELKDVTDIKQIKTLYNLNNITCEIDLLDVIVSKMVIKSFITK